MIFFADENVPRAVVAWLRGNGQDILYAAEAQPGAPDADWLREAQVAGRLILTSDKDFGELVFRDRLTSHGVVLLRLDDMTVTERIARLQTVWSVIEANPTGKFIVITDRKVRVRALATGQDEE
jgi:predicted nuclease of predicted toxin-antitoxin system